jgi:hypothetical protein
MTELRVGLMDGIGQVGNAWKAKGRYYLGILEG